MNNNNFQPRLKTWLPRTMLTLLLGGLLLSSMTLTISAEDIQLDPAALTESQITSLLNQQTNTANDDFGLSWISQDSKDTQSVAWGDADGDGDLDLAVGNYDQVNQLYVNNGSGEFNATDLGTDLHDTRSVAWGDADGDGDLDLAVGNDRQINQLYVNNGSGGFTLTNLGTDAKDTESVAWGDADGDGDLDLAVGNRLEVNQLYVNNGSGEFTPADLGTDAKNTNSIAWGDADGDGDLDLAVGNWFEVNQLYVNNGAGEFSPTDLGTDSSDTHSIAWGDADGDGDLDLAIGNGHPFGGPEQVNQLYVNNGAGEFTPTDLGTDSSNTHSVAWGDPDGDGDLDLAVGNSGEVNQIYVNNGAGGFTLTNLGTDSSNTHSVAWGDVNGDGDLDLAVGNREQVNQLYVNNGAEGFAPTDLGTGSSNTRSVAWGDADGDGDLDLAVGNREGVNQIYVNNGLGGFSFTDLGTDSKDTSSVAWGDADGDGDLDLAVGNWRQVNQVYVNNGSGGFTPTDLGTDSKETWSVAWGDADGDGDLDLAVGNGYQVNQIYVNNDSGGFTPTDLGTDSKLTLSIAWGDADGDGDLDLAVGNSDEVNQLYINNGSGGFTPTDLGTDSKDTESVAWGDADGDGDLDLAVGNWIQVNQLYLNNGSGEFTLTDLGTDSKDTKSVAWGDADGDGDLDLAVGNSWQVNQLYINNGSGGFTPTDLGTDSKSSYSVAWGDADGDGDLDLAIGNPGHGNQLYLAGVQGGSSLANNNYTVTVSRPITPAVTSFYVPPQTVASTIIPISFTLFDDESHPVGQIRAEYSLNGGGQWFPAAATSGTQIVNLETSAQGKPHVLEWDTFASGFFGQSNNVVFRIEAYSQTAMQGELEAVQYTNSAPFPIQRPYASATTYPFRVQGTQAQVFQESIGPANGVSGASVYRIPAGKTIATVMDNAANQPFETDTDGFLSGRGELQKGDEIFALLPINHINTLPLPADKVKLYHSSMRVEGDVLITHLVEDPGIQKLVVSEDNPLVLFNLDLSLEWDARQDEAYMADLRSNLREASRLLFDWTNGQMALGEINIYHNRENWDEADVQIFASNRYRPNADLGGIISAPVTIEASLESVTETLYLPGKVRMGSTWNRNGIISSDMGDDWTRAFVHELGHYLLFMDDNYFGYRDGKLIPIDSCTGVMANPYTANDEQGYDEFHSNYEWNGEENCGLTSSHLETGRSDWETLTLIYPMLSAPPTKTLTTTNGVIGWQSGPDNSPLVPTIKEVNSETTVAFQNQTFQLYDQDGKPYDANEQANAFIIRESQAGLARVVKLGKVSGDQLLARGVQPNDQLCIQNLDLTDYGCITVRPESDESFDLTIQNEAEWQPDLIVRPVSSTTIDIDLTLPASNPQNKLFVQLIPAEGNQTPSIELTQTGGQGPFKGRFDLGSTSESTETISADNATLLIWQEDNSGNKSNFTITDYEVGGSPACWRSYFGWKCRRNPSPRRAPVLSTDGRAAVTGQDLSFEQGEFYALQAANNIPAIPEWATSVGNAYRLTRSDKAPDFSEASLQLYYQAQEVPSRANRLTIYAYDKQKGRWIAQETAKLEGAATALSSSIPEGSDEVLFIILATTITPPLREGWNLFAYPDVASMNVDDALSSLEEEEFGCGDSCYTSVYHYHAISETWLLHDQTVTGTIKGKVNTLKKLEPLHTYWIYANKAVTAEIKPELRSPQSALNLGNPPATYYGEIVKSPLTAHIKETSSIEAKIGNSSCGTGEIFELGDSLGYVIQVNADNGNGCGRPKPDKSGGTEITFEVDGIPWIVKPIWDNRQAQELIFADGVDLSLEIESESVKVTKGETLTATIVVHNRLTTPSSNTRLELSLPSYLEFESTSPDLSCTVSTGNIYRCDLGSLNGGASFNVEVRLKAAGAGKGNLSAKVLSEELDILPSNNEQFLPIEVPESISTVPTHYIYLPFSIR